MAFEEETLRAFLAERLKAFDPSIDTSTGSRADSAIIQPMVERLGPDPYATPIRDMMFRRIRSEFPDLLLQPGDPLDEGIIKPAQAVVAPYRRTVQGLRNSANTTDPSLLTEQEADARMSNFFATRNVGGFAFGVARLYFTAPRSFTVTPVNRVFTGTDLGYFPVEVQSITSDSMLNQVEGSRYYFDVVVRAEDQGVDYNITEGQLAGIEGAPEVVGVTNKTDFADGLNAETSEELFSRVEGSLGERSFVQIRGIRGRLGVLFDNIQSIGVVGYNDFEMTRDVLRGSLPALYAQGIIQSDSATGILDISGASASFVDENSNSDFTTAGVELGDTVHLADFSGSVVREYTVSELLSATQVRVSPAPPTVLGYFAFLSPNRGQLTISGIPGGILVPQTPQGEIVIPNNEVHIGGHADIYVRAGLPQEKSITVSGVRDGQPLTFGIDLETFGADADEFVQVTGPISNRATTTAAYTGPGDTTAEIVVQVLDTGTTEVPWRPALTDVGRYIELLGPDYSMHQILSIVGFEVVGGRLCVRLSVNIFDEHTQTNAITVTDRASTFDLSFRVVDRVPVTSRVRDRALPQADFNGSSAGVGAVIGDSVVIESGADAGVYSIRRILSSIGEDDTLIVDRNLSATVTPSGAGDGTGVRYRIDDAIQLDLVQPRIPKVPIDPVFPGGDLSTVAASNLVGVTVGGTTNFVLAGVEIGDTLEILAGQQGAGQYTVQAVTPSQLTVDPAPPNTASNVSFQVYREFDGVDMPLVRVSEVGLLDSTNQPTGSIIPYGDVIDARVLGSLGNRAQGELINSFSGAVISGSPNLTFEDARVDFAARGVGPGWRLEIYEGTNAGEYEIEDVVGGNPNRFTIVPVAQGGTSFPTAETSLHYRVGLPSSGTARLFFLDPTSIEVDTGLLGGRLSYSEGDADFTYRFSEVSGRRVFPATSTADADLPRDLRVCRVFDLGGGAFESILEFTDTTQADVFEKEILVNDVVNCYQQIPFRNSAGTDFETLGVYGQPAGLRTTIGSNRVFVPESSLIDFTQMGDLAGQTLYITSGPDAGRYTIERVIDAKTLELDTTLTASTVQIEGFERATVRDGVLTEDPPSSGTVYLQDATDYGQLAVAGHYVSIFESTVPAVEGIFDVTSLDAANNRVDLNGAPVPSGSPVFGWVRTATNTGTLQQSFVIFDAQPTRVQVTQVGAAAPEVVGLSTGTIPGGAPPLVTLNGSVGAFSSVAQNDRLEILTGPNAGVYPVASATASSVTLYTAQPFSAAQVGVPFRIWAGVHGNLRMVRVRGYLGSSGRVAPGVGLPYEIVRPAQFRLSSTEMELNVDGGLYYADVEIESLGPGDNRNLSDASRLQVTRGYRVDGYTYQVTNNSLTFSVYEQVSLVFDRRFLAVGNTDLPENYTEVGGRNLEIKYETSPPVSIIDQLLRGTERTVVADLIAKHFLPTYLYATFIYEGGSSEAITGPQIENYVNTRGPVSLLEVSDLVRFISRTGASYIQNPVTLVGVTHDVDRNLVVERSQNRLGGTTVPYNGTGRISAFFAKVNQGLVIQRQ